MIIVCNGLYKSSSTYIHTALRLALNPTGVLEGVTLSTLNSRNPNFTKVNLGRCSDLTEEATVFKTYNYHPSLLKDIEVRPAVLWMTGLTGSGKSTIENAVEKKVCGHEPSHLPAGWG